MSYSRITSAITVVLMSGASAVFAAGEKNSSAQQPQTGATEATRGSVGEPSVQSQHVYDMIEKASSGVNFTKGLSQLTATEKDKLRAFISDMKSQYKIEEIIVAAWADQDYPPSGKSLGDAAEKLAEERAEAVEQVIKELNVDNVNTYKMAQRPNWLQKVFATEAAEIKGAVSPSNWFTDAVDLEIGKKLRAKGGPGKVVVVTKFEQQNR